MKEDNVNITIVKQLYNAFMKKEINTILGLLSDDVEWGEPENPFNPAGGTRKGHAGFMEWINIGKDAEDILVLEPKAISYRRRFCCCYRIHEMPRKTNRQSL